MFNFPSKLNSSLSSGFLSSGPVRYSVLRFVAGVFKCKHIGFILVTLYQGFADRGTIVLTVSMNAGLHNKNCQRVWFCCSYVVDYGLYLFFLFSFGGWVCSVCSKRALDYNVKLNTSCWDRYCTMSRNLCVVLFWAQYSIRHFTQTEEVKQTPIQIEKVINMFCGKNVKRFVWSLDLFSSAVTDSSLTHPVSVLK